MEKKIKLSFTVGVDFIDDVDDDLTFDYELTQEEFDKLVEIEACQLWEIEHESWHDIRFYIPELYKKIKVKTNEEGLKKWGEKFKPTDDSIYDILIPDEIDDVVRKTREYKKYLKALKKMRKMSERRWHLETDWLKNEINKGRWPGVDKTIDGTFSRGGMEANYQLVVCGLSYEKYYTLRSSEIKIRITPHLSEDFIKKLIILSSEKRSCNMTYQHIDGHDWILYFKSHEDNPGIKLFAFFLDHILI